ncbi:hypothetical protein SARC_08826 [Sphaeroforma arctica JP610]|uniref:Bromo domain-containing protein n=1 Tax=Sphaeroforma arctica JP610 TaxID=667725 RepID=A0A0L0FPL3_9EUKA|nr:hypothetical protein SARC_08826 [Sphaeroforma arctica JP610]KNC78755.1 hypothetical protein SARC_08826 [Sphaeroforma arctica JP610]|eukprot:XP_014152657.1 hypothetical protein SARC_08826 [Sphaeroforma arctica JP610]
MIRCTPMYPIQPHPTDPSVVLSGGHDGRLILWDIIEGTCLKMIWNHDPYTMNTHGITDGRFSPDGLCIAITDSFGNVSVIAPEIRGKKVEPKEQQFDERDSRSDYPVCVVNGVVMDSQLNVPIMACPDRRVCSLAGIPYAEQLTEEEYCNYWPVQPRRAVEEYVRHGDELAKAEESNLAYQLSKRTKVSTKIVALGQQEQERKLAQSRARNSAYKREMNRRRKKEQENKVSASTAVILSTSANDRLAANRRAPPLDRSGRSPAGNGTSARRRNNTVYIDADDDTIDVDAPEVVTNAPSSSDAYHVTSSEESETDVSESDTESNFSSDLSDLEYPKATRTRGRKKIASTGKRKATSKARVGSKTGANPQPNPKYKSKKRLSRGVNGTGRGKRAVESDISDDNDTPPSSDTDSGDGSDSDFGVPNRRGRKRASSASRSKARQPSRTRRTTSRARGKRPVLSSDSESADDTNNDCDDNNNNTYNNNDKDSHNNTNANANTNGSGSGDDVIAYSDIAVKPRRGRPAQTNNPLRKNQRGAAKRRRVESYAVDGDSDASADAGEGSSQGRSKGKRARTRYTSQNSQALAGSGSDSDQGMDREVVPHRGSINSAGVGTGAGSGRAAAVGMNYREQPSVEPDSEPNASDGETGMTDSEGEGERASFGSSVPKGKGKITQTPQRKRTPVPMGRGDGREHVNGDMNIPTPEGTSHTQGGRQPRVAIKSVKAVLKGTPRSRASVSVQPYDTHHRGGRKKNGVDDDGLFASNGVQPDAGSEWWDNMPLRALVAIQPVLWNCLDAREYFGDPVNINFFPDYYSTIQNPMDLGTIRDNAKEGAYTNRPSFYIRDVCLVFNNAKAYNKIESDVYKAAQHLESVFTAHLKVLWDNHKDYIELGATDNIHANEFSQTLSDAPLSARAMEQLGLLHAELITTPHTAVHFSRPVFETLRLPGFKQKELQRYLATILKPMDLHNLGICIADGMIKNLQQYASLMELSISNCVSYNLKNSNIVEQAQLLQICYRERLKQVEKAMDESGTPKVPVQLADIRKLHAGIMTSEYASMFNVPVPQHIEGYYEKITEAMDFGSIRDALNSQTVTMNEYMSDCTLVFTNCFLFNELDSPICVTCQQLRDAWLAKCNILLYGRQSSRRRQQ